MRPKDDPYGMLPYFLLAMIITVMAILLNWLVNLLR